MVGSVGSSYALFALVWALMCVVSGLLVTDAMLRDRREADLTDRDEASVAVPDRPRYSADG